MYFILVKAHIQYHLDCWSLVCTSPVQFSSIPLCGITRNFLKCNLLTWHSLTHIFIVKLKVFCSAWRNSIESPILHPNMIGMCAEFISEGLSLCPLEVYSRVMQTLHRCIVLSTGKTLPLLSLSTAS